MRIPLDSDLGRKLLADPDVRRQYEAAPAARAAELNFAPPSDDRHAEGRKTQDKAKSRQKRDKAKSATVLEIHFAPPATWTIQVEVPSLANGRQWQARSRVTQVHRRAVSRAFGRHLSALVPFAEAAHSGRPVEVSLTRLGRRVLDTDNAAASLKYVQDAVAAALGVDDGPRGPVRWSYSQIQCGWNGVMIELQLPTEVVS